MVSSTNANCSFLMPPRVLSAGSTLDSWSHFSGERRSQVADAYEAWDAAFNRGDAKAVAAAYLQG